MSAYGITPSVIVSTADPYADATAFTKDTSEFVQDQIEAMQQAAGIGPWYGQGILKAASDAITNLGLLSDAIRDLPPYTIPGLTPAPRIDGDFDVSDIDTRTFGKVDDFTVENEIDTSLLPDISEVTIPPFDPTESTIFIPPTPDEAFIAEPGDPPEDPTLVFPEKLVITLPDEPVLIPLNIPEFVAPVIPDFDPTYPTFIEQNINTFIDWQEPVYTEEVIDEVKLQLSAFFAGGSGIDPDVENNIFARSRDREDRIVFQSVQQATAEWANKGYTAPPGMLAKRLDNIREEGTLKKLGLNREHTIKVFDTEIENLRFAVQQGIAAEELFVRMFLAKVERLFEVQKLNVEWQIALYNIVLQVYLAQMEAVKIEAQVYEVKVRAALVEIEVFKALIEGEKVKADINKLLIEGYVAEISAREAMVRMYGEQVKAVGIEADVFNTQVLSYKAEVEAFAARIGADKLRYDAYASKIRGEGVKAEVLESEAKAYTAHIQGIETGVKAEVAALEGEVSALEVEIRNFEAIARGMVSKAQVQLGQIQANVAGHGVHTERYVAETGAEEAKSKVELMAWEGTNRMNIETFKADVLGYQALLDRAVKEIELLASTQKSAGELASTIAAGAMAAMHVGANLGGSSSVGSSGQIGYSNSTQQSVSCSTNNNSNLSFESDGPISHDCPNFISGSQKSGGYA